MFLVSQSFNQGKVKDRGMLNHVRLYDRPQQSKYSEPQETNNKIWENINKVTASCLNTSPSLLIYITFPSIYGNDTIQGRKISKTYIAEEVAVQWRLKVLLKILKSDLTKFLKSVTYSRNFLQSARNPSSVAHLMGPDVRLGRNSDLVRYFSLWFISI